jgi:hypothetical protein
MRFRNEIVRQPLLITILLRKLFALCLYMPIVQSETKPDNEECLIL